MGLVCVRGGGGRGEEVPGKWVRRARLASRYAPARAPVPSCERARDTRCMSNAPSHAGPHAAQPVGRAGAGC
eukprot:963615-Prymnesium_polylepis.1